MKTDRLNFTDKLRRPVFISSTSFDLKDLRAELAEALKEWGYFPIWNESPDFPKTPGLHSHDVCLDAVKECDIYLLIIDRRYGGTYTGEKYSKEDISITWYETKIAFQENKEMLSFVRDEVWNERPTYKKNLKNGIRINPHHVDDPRVFDFIDFIVHLPRDNWIYTFKNSVELKDKLKTIVKISKIILPPYLNNITPPEPNFVGRAEMLGALSEWYKNPDIHIGALISWGGEGKSAIARQWYDTLKENNIHPHGIFWWGFYRNAYLDLFLDSLFNYLSQDRLSLNDYRTSWLKVDKIKELLLEGEYLIILDGLEEMQKGEETAEMFASMLHREFAEILKFLAEAKVKGLCLITSRYPLTDIKKWESLSYRRLEVERLCIKEGEELFKKVGVGGNQDNIDSVIEDYKGHALSLTLLATYLVEDHKGDIEKAKGIPPFYSDKEAGGKAHRILLWYEKQITETYRSFMKIFSLFRRTVRNDDFEGVFRSKMETSLNKELRDMSEFSFIRMKDNLCDRRLISRTQNDTYTTHPLIKGYFESIINEDDKKACHKRIYEYIGSYAHEMPDTLERMEPLFEQGYHGCAAGLYDEAFDIYHHKVQQGQEFFLTWKLGAWETNLSLISNFFQGRDFQKDPLVLKQSDKSYIINTAGASMHCLGRLKEAEGLYKKKIDLDISQKDWENASVGYQNFALLQILIGNLLEAKKSFKKAIQLSKKVKSVKQERYSTAYFAYTLFLLGDMAKASIEFEKAGELERKYDSSVRYLYSSRGVCYADFLLAQGMIEKALDVTQQNIKICKKYNWVDDINFCHRSLASIYYCQKKIREAEENARVAIEQSRKTGRQGIEVESLIELAKIKIDQGLYQDSEFMINQALQICQRCDYCFYEPNAEVVLAKVYWVLGDIDRARGFANSAYKKADQMNYNWPKIEAANLLSEISVNKKT